MIYSEFMQSLKNNRKTEKFVWFYREGGFQKNSHPRIMPVRVVKGVLNKCQSGMRGPPMAVIASKAYRPGGSGGRPI